MKRVSIAAIALTLLFTVHGPAAQASTPEAARSAICGGFDQYYRTELYFGRSIPSGGSVTDEDWERFVTNVVVPRFPDGFTILQAIGKYRQKDGQIISEPSLVLVFLYPGKARTASRRKIEEIRRAYVKQFAQESVLRLDFPLRVNVSF